jgi:type I restriction enzyme M protein
MNQDLKKTLWAAADKLRSSMDAAEYKHIVLGLIFLKYISDAFDERRAALSAAFGNEADDLYLPDVADHAEALEERDYYTMANVFWVPTEARWETLRGQAKQADIGVRIDHALEAIEAANPRLKGILDKRFGRTQFEPGRLGELVDLISGIGFGEGHRATDLLGEVYEYFLGQFASAEGKKGGQFYTPASVVKVLVEVLAPDHGRVYDPCCGSGGMFVQSERFIEAHGGKVDAISIYGQEANPTTWRLVAMNLAIRGFAADLGKEAADSFHRDQHPDLRADFILANPPFNISDWGGERLQGDPRWMFGTPPTGNANFAWLQHIYYHLSPRGSAGVVLANGSMGGNQSGEGDIRKGMVDADCVEIMIALPPQLFINTQIPACLWFLSKDKGASKNEGKNLRDRQKQILFIDARRLGSMASRVSRVFEDDDIRRIADTVARWRSGSTNGPVYEDEPGFSRSVGLSEVANHDYVLSPARYVGAEEVEEDAERLAERVQELAGLLVEQRERVLSLERIIDDSLRKLGYVV